VLLLKGLLPDRSSCQDVFGFTDPTSLYMSHSRGGVKSSWVFFAIIYYYIINIDNENGVSGIFA
jgi:hypothetical protein